MYEWFVEGDDIQAADVVKQVGEMVRDLVKDDGQQELDDKGMILS
jgi:hypothetical protein